MGLTCMRSQSVPRLNGGTSTGPTADSRQSQRHFLRPAQPLPPRLHLLVGESPDPRPLPGSDPCLGLTRSLRMFVYSEVNIGQEVMLNHMTVCFFGPTLIMLLSVPQPCLLRGIRGLKGSKSYSLHLLLSRGGP